MYVCMYVYDGDKVDCAHQKFRKINIMLYSTVTITVDDPCHRQMNNLYTQPTVCNDSSL